MRGRKAEGQVTGNVVSGTVHGSVIQAETVGDVHIHGPTPPPVIPFQLPPAPRLFTSRHDELTELDGWRAADDDHPLVAVISGPGGVGKTSLALRWLHDAREHFPDGQLFVDLDAHASAGPATPDEVLEWFLLALGVETGRIPLELAQRQALFRSVTNDRSFAVLLDNAASVAQVRPLLPTTSGSTVVVTSRWRLSGLAMDGARFVEVDPMDVPASVELLARAVGDRRLTAEPDAARELASLCGGLPIALSVVGARLSTHPRRSLSKEVGELRGENDRLSALAIADSASVEAVFDLSYVDLPAEQARLYRLSAWHPGLTFGIDVAAAAMDEPVPEIEDLLDGLVEKNLITEVADGRFRFHDLLRLHARQQADWSSEQERAAAERRMIEWYLDRAVEADLVVLPHRPRLGSRYLNGGRQIAVQGRAEALDWLEAERGNLVNAVRIAAERRWHDLVWQLCEALWGLFLFRHHYADWIETHLLGVSATRELGHQVAEARTRTQLGIGYAGVGRQDDAADQFTAALGLAEQTNDLGSRATALLYLGRTFRSRGELERALRYFREALSAEVELGRRRGEALARRRIGEVLTDLDRLADAVAEFERGEVIMAELGGPVDLARLRTFLASAHLKAGDLPKAAALLEVARAVMADSGSPTYLADVRLLMAQVSQRQGDLGAARAHCLAAQEAFAGTDEAVPERVTTLLAALSPENTTAEQPG